MAELVIAGKGKLEGDAKGLGRHDGDGADGGANREIDERILLAVERSNSVNHEDGKGNHGNRVEKEAFEWLSATASRFGGLEAGGRHTRLHGVVQDLINSLNLLIGWCVQDNDDGANQADGTPQLAQNAELFLEKV